MGFSGQLIAKYKSDILFEFNFEIETSQDCNWASAKVMNWFAVERMSQRVTIRFGLLNLSLNYPGISDSFNR